MKLEGKDLVKLAASVGVCLAAGAIGSFATISNISTWYAALQKPWFTPPNWLFGPAWTTLYVLMGVALFLVWKKGFESKGVKTAVGVFAVQLVLNVLWSVAFFGMQSPLLGLVVIALLWLAIAASIYVFWKISRPAAALLVPYIAWVSFAAFLNYSVWLLN